MRTSTGADRTRRSALLLALVALLGGCEEGPVTPGGVVVRRVDLNPPSFGMAVGEVIRLDVLPRNASGRLIPAGTLAWASSDPSVVAVDSLGLVRALREGSADVTVSVDGVTGSARATVGPAPVSEWREHACFLSLAGSAWCWGRGANGELGNGARLASAVPVLVRVDEALAQVSAGAGHGCAVATSGAVWCWGRGAEGQLGDGATATRSVPVRVSDATGYRSVSAGGRHSCGITAAGDARCWGWGAHGQLGAATTASVSTPVQVQGGAGYRAITAGARHSCALDAQGRAFCWGDNEHGQLGDGTHQPRTIPVPVLTALRFTDLSAGARHTCGVATDGTAWCWGDNRQGQHGNGTLSSSTVPQDVRSAPGFRLARVSAGGSHTCGIAASGVAYCWGAGQFGQLGNGAHILNGNPVAVGVALFDEVVPGSGHTCGVSQGRSVLCWGLNAFGQLGTGDFADRAVPTTVVGDILFGRAEG